MQFFIPPNAICISLLLCLSTPVSARVAHVRSKTADGFYEASLLTMRENSVCGGIANLQQCGNSFPSNFCCDASAACLRLNASSSVTAVICCPAGQDCTTISPIGCDQSSQDPSVSPSSQLHSNPTIPLQTCGDNCCPMGYGCHNSICVATLASTSSISNSTTVPAPSSPTPPSSSSSSSSSSSDPVNVSIVPTANEKKSSGFSGSAFAAGFVPGIILGALIVAGLTVWLIRRRNQRQAGSNEKMLHRDTLTNLEPFGPRPTHNRSISDPIPDPSTSLRTDFLRSSPSGNNVKREWHDGSNSSADVNATTPMRTPRIKALFSRSPFMEQTSLSSPSSQSSLPSHLKRGTLSFKVTPVRALRKQRSIHSLRRQATNNARPSDDSSRRLNASSSASPVYSRGNSQETIQVHLRDSTPATTLPITPPMTANEPWSSNHRTTSPQTHVPPQSTTPPIAKQYASSSRYPTQYGSPPHFGQSPNQPLPFLGTPYTPTRHAGNSPREAQSNGGDDLAASHSRNRDTTFSALMERAGLRKSDLVMGARK